jgi:hypothetical protein
VRRRDPSGKIDLLSSYQAQVDLVDRYSTEERYAVARRSGYVVVRQVNETHFLVFRS